MPFTQYFLLEAHTFDYFQSLWLFVRKHSVRILLPSLNQHDREVSELQRDLPTWLPWWQRLCEEREASSLRCTDSNLFHKPRKTWSNPINGCILTVSIVLSFDYSPNPGMSLQGIKYQLPWSSLIWLSMVRVGKDIRILN